MSQYDLALVTAASIPTPPLGPPEFCSFFVDIADGLFKKKDATGTVKVLEGSMPNPLTTVGDVLYASVSGAPATPARLGIGAAGEVLTVSGGLPVWQAPAVSVFGESAQAYRNNVFASTTLAALQTYDTWTTTSVGPGDYVIDVFIVYSHNSTGGDMEIAVDIDTVELINPTPSPADGQGGVMRWEPQDSGGGGNGGTDQRHTMRALGIETLAGTSTRDIRFRYASGNGNLASIHYVRAMFYRMS